MHFLWPLRNFRLFECDAGKAAFKKRGRFVILAGSPQASDSEHQVEVLRRLESCAHEQGSFLCGYYLPLRLISHKKSPRVCLGREATILLDEFTLKGGRWEEARRARNIAARKKWRVEFAEDNRQLEAAKSLYRKWRKTKGWLKVGFLLGDLYRKKSLMPTESSCLLIDENKKELAFINYYFYLDEYGKKSAYVDSLIYDPKASRLALSTLLVALAQHLKAQDYQKVNLGLCPFVIDEPKHWMEIFFRFLYRTGFLYNSKGLYLFKKRFATSFEDQYLLLDESPSAFAQLIQLTRVSLSR